MSKKYAKKKKSNKLTLVLAIIALVLAAVTGGLLLATRGMGESDDPVQNDQTELRQDPTDAENPDAQVPGTEGSSEQGTENPDRQTEETRDNSGSDKDSDPDKNTGKNNNSGKNNNGSDSQPEETRPGTSETQPPVVIVERKDAEYERWLAAAMLMGVSMEYPDFELTGIYISSETSIEDKMNSDGAYILFTSGGETMAVHSVPQNGERSAAGTRDLSTETLGFATFDSVDPESVDTASMTKLDIEDLSELIAQSLLVSVYIH